MNQGFLPGDELVLASTGKTLYEVEKRLPRIQSVRVLDLEKQTECVLAEAPLRLQVALGELRIKRMGVDWEEALSRRQSGADDEKLHAAMRVMQAIEQLRKRYEVSFNKAFCMLREQGRSDDGPERPTLPSRSQAYRWWQRHRAGLPLRLGDVYKGNRSRRYDVKVDEVIKDLADTHYLQVESRWDLPTLTDFINLTLHDSNLLPKTQAVSKAYVQRVIQLELDADPEHARMDPRDAVSAKAVASQRIRISGIFERVEQDGLHLPFVVKTIHGVSKDIWLVHAIDCCTSTPVGWCLLIGSPRVPSTLKCIETILFPKAPLVERLGLKYDFDIYGTPLQLVMDNGPETGAGGPRMTRLTQLGIDPHWLRSRHPQRKPFIERLNRSLKEELETLPGCTRLNGKDGKRDPIALGDDLMTLEELEQWIVRFFFERWVNRKLKRFERSVLADFADSDRTDLGATPRQRYQVLTEQMGYPVPLPPSIGAWRSVVYEQEFRTLSRTTGISYATYHFKGDRLPYLIHQFGETEVKVLIDPDDYRMVYVVDRDGRSLVPLVNADAPEGSAAFSFAEAAAILKAARQDGLPVDSLEFRRDLFLRSAGLEAPPEKPKKPSKRSVKGPTASQTTTQKARQHEAVQRAAARPLPATQPTIGQPAMGSAQEDWALVAPLKVLDRKGSKDSQ